MDVGFDKIADGINKEFEKMIPSEFPHTTIANPFPVFDKGYGAENQGTKEQEEEQKSICTYTEMCNPNVQTPGGKPTARTETSTRPSRATRQWRSCPAAYEANPAK